MDAWRHELVWLRTHTTDIPNLVSLCECLTEGFETRLNNVRSPFGSKNSFSPFDSLLNVWWNQEEASFCY